MGTFCYSDDWMFSAPDEYTAYCESIENEEECLMSGCKSFKKGKCKAQTKKVNCKKLGDKKDKDKTSDAKKALCYMYSLMGCEWNAKKGCSGKVDVKQKKKKE